MTVPSEHPMYAHVIVDVPARSVDRHYDYIVPPEHAGEIGPGVPVVVPFGPRSVQGFVVGIADSSGVDNPKQIQGIAPGVPRIPQHLLELARWISRTYMCLPIEAIKAMTPSGVMAESSVVVRLTADGNAIRTARVPAPARQVLAYLWECGGEASRAQIVAACDSEAAVRHIPALVRAGLIDVVTEWQGPRVRRLTARGYRLPPDANGNERALEIERRSPARARILRVLAERGELKAAELAQAADCSVSTLAASARDGLIDAVDIMVERTPEMNASMAPHRHAAALVLTPAQQGAVGAVRDTMSSGGGVVLLHGVTGSGKTEVYLNALEEAIRRGKQGIFLVPDIALTPQMVAVVTARFGRRVAVLHSALGAGERRDEWERALRGDVDVVVGARSAVFAPVPDLGVIVVDEEHDTSYKQDVSPRYNARETAIERARTVGATVILGSATPSLESYGAASDGRYRLVELPQRIDDRPLPEICVVDMRTELKAGNRTVFSRTLRARIEQTLSRGEQAMLFLNRRGFSTFVLCRDCGYVCACPNCDVSMTYHARARAGQEMVCHYCNHVEGAPGICPDCGGTQIKFFGVGTQRIEDEVRRAFPTAVTARMDVDTTRRKGAHAAILGAFREGRTDILIGTQMIAKGLDFPKVTTVGVISADTALNLPDFRAAERTFQLISQVAGRAGRGHRPGSVVVQTYNPDHYSIRAAASHDYRAFYEAEMRSRYEEGYPPARRMGRILLRGSDEQQVARAAGHVAAACRDSDACIRGTVDVRGPAPAPISRIAGKYRWHLLLFSAHPELVAAVCADGCARSEAGVTISVDIDPSSVL